MVKVTKDSEILVQAVSYFESLIVSSKDLVFIYLAVYYLKKAIDEGGAADD